MCGCRRIRLLYNEIFRPSEKIWERSQDFTIPLSFSLRKSNAWHSPARSLSTLLMSLNSFPWFPITISSFILFSWHMYNVVSIISQHHPSPMTDHTIFLGRRNDFSSFLPSNVISTFPFPVAYFRIYFQFPLEKSHITLTDPYLNSIWLFRV